MYGKNFHKEPTQRQKIGSRGEDLVCEYLIGLGWKILERNYSKKWGEIDIVAKNSGKIHFVEVKSVSREIKNDVIYETPVVEQSSLRGKQGDSYRPEDNMHPWKLQRLGRAVQSYLLDRDVPESVDWQFDLVTVYIDERNGTHKIEVLEDIVL